MKVVIIASWLLVLPLAPWAQGSAEDENARIERLAEQRFEEDDLESAISLYRQLADRLEPAAERVRILMNVAWLQHLLDDNAAALKTLTEVLVLMPDYRFRAELYSESFRDFFLEAQAAAVRERTDLATETINRGNERMRQGDLAGARQLFSEALAITPDHPQALYNLALVDLHEDRYEEALAGFQKILALDASRPEQISDRMRGLALTNLGFLYNRRQLYQEAEQVLSEAVELDPGNQAAWSNLGVTRRRLGRMQAAADAFRRAYELAPDDAAVMNNLALAYIDVEDWIEAVALLRKATARFAVNSSLWLNLGLAQLGMGNHNGAIESFEAAIRHDPDDARGWASAAGIHLARLYYSVQDYRRALEQADRTLAWRPLADAWIYQGLSRKALGDLDGARRSLEEARRIDPARAEIHNNLGSVYFELHMLDEAEAAFRRALAIEPDLTSAHENLDAIALARAQQPTTAPIPGTYRTETPPPSSRPRLGLTFSDIDYSALGLKGVMIAAVDPGSPASRADVRKDDLILKVDGQEVASADELRRLIYQHPDGATITIDLLRANRPTRVYLTIE